MPPNWRLHLVAFVTELVCVLAGMLVLVWTWGEIVARLAGWGPREPVDGPWAIPFIIGMVIVGVPGLLLGAYAWLHLVKGRLPEAIIFSTWTMGPSVPVLSPFLLRCYKRVIGPPPEDAAPENGPEPEYPLLKVLAIAGFVGLGVLQLFRVQLDRTPHVRLNVQTVMTADSTPAVLAIADVRGFSRLDLYIRPDEVVVERFEDGAWRPTVVGTMAAQHTGEVVLQRDSVVHIPRIVAQPGRYRFTVPFHVGWRWNDGWIVREFDGPPARHSSAL